LDCADMIVRVDRAWRSLDMARRGLLIWHSMKMTPGEAGEGTEVAGQPGAAEFVERRGDSFRESASAVPKPDGLARGRRE
jgi:hypothetical protein